MNQLVQNICSLSIETIDGDLEKTHNPNELASLMMTFNFGLRVQSRQQLSRQALKSIIENRLSLLGLAA